MAVYSNFLLEAEGGIHAESLPPVDVESLVDDKKIEAAWEENSYDAAMRVVAENTINFNNIMEACAIQEFCYFEENGTEMVYTEAAGEGFWNSVKNFFKKIWEKIQSIFKKVIMQFMSWAKNDKDFLKKYEKDIRKNIRTQDSTDIEVKVYPYTPFLTAGNADAIKNAVEGAQKTGPSEYQNIAAFCNACGISGVDSMNKDSLKDAIKKLNEDPDHITSMLDKYRSTLIKKMNPSYSSTEVDANDFAKELAEACQGDDSKEDKNISDVINPAMKFLEFSDKAKSELGKVLSADKKSIDKSIKQISDFQKRTEKKMTDKNVSDTAGDIYGARHTLYTKWISAMKSEKNILVQFNGACLQHLKACSRQCKAVCVKAATFKAKNESAFDDESGYVQTESNISLLDAVELI